MTKEELIKSYFAGWAAGDKETVEKLLDGNFTFTSPVDDHLDAEAFFKKCWSLSKQIDKLTVDRVIEKGDEAYVTYTSHSGSHSARCTEFFRFNGKKIIEIDVFWGFPSTGIADS